MFEAWYAREGTSGWPVKSWETANALLSYLQPVNRSFASFTIAGGSYVQCAGAKTRLTVEVRIVREDGSFTHLVFGKGQLQQRVELIASSAGHVTVDASQVLKMRDARLIIREFVEHQRLHAGYLCEDVTSRFRRQLG